MVCRTKQVRKCAKPRIINICCSWVAPATENTVIGTTELFQAIDNYPDSEK